jgi:hypothetical protein
VRAFAAPDIDRHRLPPNLLHRKNAYYVTRIAVFQAAVPCPGSEALFRRRREQTPATFGLRRSLTHGTVPRSIASPRTTTS